MINFCDLKAEHDLLREELKQIMDAAVDASDFCNGAAVRSFEKAFGEYVGVKNVCGVSNGTSALFLAMRALGIGEGDEVIVPSNTFVATAWAATYNGAVPVFCDCKSDTWEIDPESVMKKITKKTKAIAGVHLYGQTFDFDAIKSIADEYGLMIIEDCAQAHGATFNGRKTGTMGDIGCFSFYPTKNLGAMGDAGAVVTDSDEIARKINLLKFYAFEKSTGDHIELGFNTRMDSIQAAILELKLKKLDENNEKRRRIARIYLNEIDNPVFTMQTVDERCKSVWHLFVMKVPDREHFTAYMRKNGVNCGVHYPVPCHLQRAFSSLGYKKGDLPECEDLAQHCISLPMYPELTDEQILKVVELCNRYGR